MIDLLKRSVPIRSESAMVEPPKIQFDIQHWHESERFIGEPKPRLWLVEGIFPMAQAALVAAGGGVGKSFLLLSLAREVAAYDGSWAHAPYLFGGALRQQGVAIYVTAEDDAIEVHNRLNTLGEIPKNLYVIPLPDAGGAVPLFAPDPATRGPAATAAWQELERQLKTMPELRLVVLAPLQPLCALDLNVPENAQFVCSKLAALAATTGASVVVSHHFAKREASNPEQAREAIRGTGGLVDGVRSVYALWNPKVGEVIDICETLEVDYQRGCVVQGGVVKANGKANLNVTTYLRDRSGLLIDQSKALRCANPTEEDLLRDLKEAIARAAVDGQPYTKTGGNGVYERRHELPETFHSVGKHKFSHWVGVLLGKGELVAAMAEGSKMVKWLDVPDGPVANGRACFRLGHVGRSSPGGKAEIIEVDLL
ncbi:AAA family ATPase [Methylomonas sp. 2BW1-5-20]|uniref:AAA family ATPase n=1 Tax=Methylomonas sp. 2BW1-5-20 TaxID=3376686 RepID=UPI004051CA18